MVYSQLYSLLMYAFLLQNDDKQQNDFSFLHLRTPRALQRMFASQLSKRQVKY